MTAPHRPQPASRGAVLTLMAFVMLWSGVLAAGFGYAAVAGADEVGLGRTLIYGVLAAFTGLLSARTAYEMIRKLRGAAPTS